MLRRLFAVCSRRAAREPREAVVDAWERLVRRLRRLAYLRRLWAHLGHYLRIVKERGRAQ